MADITTIIADSARLERQLGHAQAQMIPRPHGLIRRAIGDVVWWAIGHRVERLIAEANASADRDILGIWNLCGDHARDALDREEKISRRVASLEQPETVGAQR